MKNLFLLFVVSLCFASVTVAAPIASGDWVDYEYYQSETGQYVQEGDTFYFDFDFAFENDIFTGGTDSSLSLLNDVEGYTGNFYFPNDKPINSLWASISLFSDDIEWEQFELDVMAYSNYQTYDLTTMLAEVGTNTSTATFIYEIKGDLLSAWQDDPYGSVQLSVTSLFTNNIFGDNDFYLREVGMGAAPVPEPGTFMLLGAGLIGLAFLKRRNS